MQIYELTDLTLRDFTSDFIAHFLSVFPLFYFFTSYTWNLTVNLLTLSF